MGCQLAEPQPALGPLGVPVQLATATTFANTVFTTLAAMDVASFTPPARLAHMPLAPNWAPAFGVGLQVCSLRSLPVSHTLTAAPIFRLYLGE